jgi:uncharacterized protein
VDHAALAEPLDAASVRVLGALMEKEVTTPDNYPLTLNALTAACNQATNRYPVMQLDEAAVADSLKELADRALVRAVHRSDSRARRYRHLVVETLHLHAAEAAVLCVLMLRGAQTPGEIRARTGRLFEFDDPAQLELTLQSLATLSQPLVTQLPRQPGQKEARYAHLLSGEPDVQAHEAEAAEVAAPPRASRLDALEEEVRTLRHELVELRARLDAFTSQFQ